jgi:hypothetical protein
MGAIDPDFALIGLLGPILTGMGQIGNLACVERGCSSLKSMP